LYLYDTNKMTLKLIVEKLGRSKKKFITANELKDYCRKLSIDYITTIKYLIRNKYVSRIFRGIFYVYSIEERKLGKVDTDFYEILKEAFKLKGIFNWYFGLETALKLNNLTHETFTTYFIINDKLFRAKPIIIMGRRVKFYKLSPKLLSFGIIKNNLIYSDPEKTALDLLYLKHYSLGEFDEISEKMLKTKIIKYAKNYPKRVLESTKI